MLRVLIVLTCEIGFLTPPVGANLFVAMRLAKVSLGSVSKAALPFLIAYFVVVAIVAVAPREATALPDLVYGKAR